MASRRRLHPPPHEPQLCRGERRAKGVYFTPPEIARFLAERALAAWHPADGEMPHVLDLACGAGALLKAVGEELARLKRPSVDLLGLDCDPAAIASARHELARFRPQLHAADGLLGEIPSPESFDLIVGNPPFVNIREAGALATTASRARLSSRFRSARGHYDLYVLFIERAWELLAPGGVLAFIIPDKFGSAEYARPCRQLLLREATILEVHDLGEEQVFREAAVYPWMLILRKARAPESHLVRFSRWWQHRATEPLLKPQIQLSPDGFSFANAMDVESRTPTEPLGTRATLACGAMGYRAQRLADLLYEADAAPPAMATRPFIVSGNVDPYVIKRQPVRYLRRKYEQPVMHADSGLSEHQRALFARKKLVIAGLASRIEAAWDDVGHALGVQVFAAYDLADDPFYLLGLLNSQLLSAIYRERFAARRLAGGFLTFNKGPLAKLPIRALADANAADRRCARAISQAAKELHDLSVRSNLDAFVAKRSELTAEIDAAVLRLYRVAAKELNRSINSSAAA